MHERLWRLRKTHTLQRCCVNRVKACGNVTVVEGDVLKAELPVFDKVVAIPPYYLVVASDNVAS